MLRDCSMLEQPHLNQPYVLHQLRNTMPPVSYIQENQPAIPRWDGTRPGQPSYVRYTIENSYGAYPGHNYLNCDVHHRHNPKINVIAVKCDC